MAYIQIPARSSDKVFHRYLTTVSVLIIMSVCIQKGDDVLFINGLNNFLLDRFFSLITNLGDGLIFIPIILILLFVNFHYALMGLSICILSGVVSGFLKHVIFPGFPRPKNVIDNNLLHFIDGIHVHGSNSFPSGHTMTAFCAALFITLISKNKIVGALCLVIAILVGYSRIYLLQHFLMDVTAGAIIGCLCTCLIWYLFDRYRTPTWMNKKISINIKQTKREGQLGKI